MFKKTGLWRGLAGLFSGLMILIIFATMILFDYAPIINNAFNIKTSDTINGESAEDTDYYKSTIGDGQLNAENLKTLIAATEEQTVKEAEEGAVLLKNDAVNGTPALPLDVGNERKVSLFGRACYSPLYKTNAAVSKAADNNPERLVDLKSALTAAGFEINGTLFDAYASRRGGNASGYSFGWEAPRSFYEAQQGSLSDYKDVAIVMLTRFGGEGNDMNVDQAWNVTANSENLSFTYSGQEEEHNSLALQTNEKDMLNFVKEQGFGKVILLINTNYMMELDWLDEYGVDAALFIGTPGLKGFTGVVNVMTGKANPSGRLVDTFAASSLSSPAIVNAADNTPQWANYGTSSYPSSVTDVMQNTSWVSVQQESIYVGYKYYETRYYDAVLGDAGAKSEVGSSFEGGWDYAKEMCYPFGFGLSYTSFRETITGVTENDDNTYTVTVKVENTGSLAGKDAVLVYVNTPYGDYEKDRKIEKSAILFVAFDKTDLLKPGESTELEIEVEEYLFASYDYTDTKGYVLTAGDYYFAVGGDAHAALNNVLGTLPNVDRASLVDQDGKAATTDSQAVYHWTKELDTKTYQYGEDGTTVVTNQFEKSDINYWENNSVKYLTRSDWSGTFPTEAAKAYLNSGEMASLLQGDFYTKAQDVPSTDIYAQGKSNNWQGVNHDRTFVSMRHYDYDDEAWDEFIDQFSLDDLVKMTGNYFANNAIQSQPINIPGKNGGDGCQGIGGDFGAFPQELTGGESIEACLYTSLLACTFNKDLIESRGTLMGNEGLFLGQTVIWTGGGNLHRTPYGGRNAEYYSEDANLCYLIGAIELPAMEKMGVMGGIKHFAGNDQESHREGLNTFYNEQAFREGALRGFEGALRKGKVHSVMQAFSRQGVIFSSSCSALNNTVLRGEWGFRGQVITDASNGDTVGYKAHYTTTMANGTNVYCLDRNSTGGGIIADYIKANDDGAMLGYLRESAKNVAFALSRSSAINGLTDDSVVIEIMPTWQILTLVGMSLIIVLAVGSLAMFVVSDIHTRKENKEAENED